MLNNSMQNSYLFDLNIYLTFLIYLILPDRFLYDPNAYRLSLIKNKIKFYFTSCIIFISSEFFSFIKLLLLLFILLFLISPSV